MHEKYRKYLFKHRHLMHLGLRHTPYLLLLELHTEHKPQTCLTNDMFIILLGKQGQIKLCYDQRFLYRALFDIMHYNLNLLNLSSYISVLRLFNFQKNTVSHIFLTHTENQNEICIAFKIRLSINNEVTKKRINSVGNLIVSLHQHAFKCRFFSFKTRYKYNFF